MNIGMVSTRRKSPWKMAIASSLLTLLGLLSILQMTGSMVVTSAPKRARQTPSVFRDDSDHAKRDSGELLRMLLQGQGGNSKAPLSYSLDISQEMTKVNGSESANDTTTTTSTTTSATAQSPRTSPLLNDWRDYEALRETNLEDEILKPFFFESGWERKQIISNRFFQVVGTLWKAKEDWTEYQRLKQQQAASSKTATNPEDDEVSLKVPTTDDPAALRLCQAVASLGPLAVKLGQTLSQRPDIVGKDACIALKRLQTQNTPFADQMAYAVIRESLDYWDGPLAANIDEGSTSGTAWANADAKPLFECISKEPIASASLGQVYKATTWEGVDIALKVQRPDALSILAIDTQCFRIASNVRNTLIDWGEQWNALVGNSKNLDDFEHSPETGMTEEEVRQQGEDGTVASVIDRVAKDIKREMDFRVEAENSYKFRQSLEFLGFVDTPDVLLATDKVLATKFVNGHHLDALSSPREELALTRMAVEACTASMVLTGFVHADPHEGNLMLNSEDGRIVFLDFGLMSDVEENIMESFAQGIQALLSEDFVSMTEAFSDTGFITTPIMHRESTDDLWKVDPKYGLQELADDMEHHMKTTEGGLSRFGALATVLNKKISPNWLVFTPPYVLLLIRTFLTLEGIAAQVDPDFNIYEMSLPWVVKRSLSPSTERGRRVLRNTILKKDNKIQWERLMELMEMQKAAAAEAEASNDAVLAEEPTPLETTAATATEESSSTSTAATTATGSVESTTATKKKKPSTVPAARTREEKERKQKEFAAAQKGAMKDAIGTLLGSTNGRALRGVLKDLDTPDLIWKLGSKQGRPILKMGTEKALNNLFSSGGKSASKKQTTTATATTGSSADTSSSKSLHEEIENYRPISQASVQLREKQAKRTKKVTRFLMKRHLRKCLLGTKGLFGITRLAVATLQIATALILRKMMRGLLSCIPKPATATARN